jgi:hypothetical protein
MRLAEDGFLPWEEAMAIYSYRKPEASSTRIEPAGETQPSPVPVKPEEEQMLVPFAPILYAQRQNLLAEGVRNMDPLLLDRIRIEFAGLCSQIMAADNVRPDEFEVLIKVGKTGRPRPIFGGKNIKRESLGFHVPDWFQPGLGIEMGGGTLGQKILV